MQNLLIHAQCNISTGTETSQHVNQFAQNMSPSSLQGNNSKWHGKIFKSSSMQTSSSCIQEITLK